MFAHNDAGYVKRYGGNGYLLSLNPNYSDITVSDNDSFKILGRVLGKIGE